MDIEKMIDAMTLEEKASLCSGQDVWHTKSIERLAIPSILMTDGPHGLRKHSGSMDDIGIKESEPATCYPPAVNLASTWDLQRIEEVGRHLAIEAKSKHIDVVLGPGTNLKRHPFGGRNFEYFSEDPYLSGHAAAAMVMGLQKEQVGASLKHYACNNQETARMFVDTILDERTLRELYLEAFEIAIKKSNPWTVMTAYNKINGDYAAENEKLLKDILRDTWNYSGTTVTDWGGINDRVRGLKATQDLEMPSSKGINDQKIVEAVKNGDLDESVLNDTVRRILKLIEKTQKDQKMTTFDLDRHHAFAREVAADSMVLLKNDGILPLNLQKDVAVIGAFAQHPRYQGGGSSRVEPTRLESFLDVLKQEYPAVKMSYEQGYHLDQTDVDPMLIERAVAGAKKHEVALVFAGLFDIDEAEGYDRETLDLPASQNRLIEAIAQNHDHVVVLLSNGAPVTMPWRNHVSAIFECYLGGQGQAGAILDLIYGKTNPSGKLAETFLNSHLELLSDHFFPGTRRVIYKEGLYVGYRYVRSVALKPLFPFGYGLSYTTFGYENLRIVSDKNRVTVSCTIRNEGTRTGKEVVQVYIQKRDSSVYRPKIALRGFAKIEVAPNEAQDVTIELDQRSFEYFDVKTDRFVKEGGTYDVLVGASSEDIRLEGQVLIEGEQPLKVASPYDTIDALFLPTDADFASLYGKQLEKEKPIIPYTRASPLSDLSYRLIGKIILKRIMKKELADITEPSERKMTEAFIRSLPLKGLVSFGHVSHEVVDALIHLLNRRYLKALKSYRKRTSK
jgi:beta-glucosidase